MFDQCVGQNWLNRKLLPSHNGLISCRFGHMQEPSLVAISNSQDKLFVFTLNCLIKNSNLSEQDQTVIIASREVVCSVTSVANSIKSQHGDYLLIGCAARIIIYDTLSQTNLTSVSTTFRVSLFAIKTIEAINEPTVVGASLQKIFATRVHASSESGAEQVPNVDITCEKNVSDSLTCLVQGTFCGQSLILTGSAEGKIRAFKVDNFDYNVQNSELMIEESAQVCCLCGILAQIPTEGRAGITTDGSDATSLSLLPSIAQSFLHDAPHAIESSSKSAESVPAEEMSYFAFGLQDGSIGVYSLFRCDSSTHDNKSATWTLKAERVWRHKCKQVPVKLITFDINGDGSDELIIGYRSGRLEARSPLSGQLLAATRCFKSDRLLSLSVIHESLELGNSSASVDEALGLVPSSNSPRPMSAGRDYNFLIACSINGHLMLVKARRAHERRPLNAFHSAGRGNISESPNDELGVAQPITEEGPSLLNLAPIDELSLEQMLELRQKSPPIDEEFDEHQRPQSAIVRCVARQSVDLLQKVGQQQSELWKLKQQAREVYHSTIQQMSNSISALASQFGGQVLAHIAHRWQTRSKPNEGSSIELSVVIVSHNSQSIDYLELVEPRATLIDKGRAIHSALESRQFGDGNQFSLFRINFEARNEQKSDLLLRLTCTSADSSSDSRLIEKRAIARVFERTINVPKFRALVARRKVSSEQEERAFAATSIGARFDLRTESDDQRDLQMQIVDWLGSNLLCFQLGLWFDPDCTDSSTWSECLESMGEADSKVQASLSQLLAKHSLNDIINSWSASSGGLVDKSFRDGFEFQLSLQNLANGRHSTDGVPTNMLITLTRDSLKLESDDHSLMTDIIRALVIDHLKMSATSINLESNRREQSLALEPMLKELESLTISSQELEVSERRLQTELFEASDLINNLMQQLSIAQQIDECAIFKELLSEITMLYDGAQNSTKSYFLNNCERLRLSKSANCLRDNLNFLMGQ